MVSFEVKVDQGLIMPSFKLSSFGVTSAAAARRMSAGCLLKEKINANSQVCYVITLAAFVVAK